MLGLAKLKRETQQKETLGNKETRGNKGILRHILQAAVFFFPLIVYALIFFEYEPYNFWGLRDDSGDANSPVTMIRRIENNPDAENIILSASRLAPVVAEELNEAGFTDEEWLNLAFTGAIAEEQCDMFWEAAERLPLKKVIFTMSLWDAIDRNVESRVTRDAPIAESGVTYVASPESHWETWNLFRTKIPKLFKSTTPAKALSDKQKLKNYADYVDRVWVPFSNVYRIDTHYLSEIIKVIKYCKENDIDLRVVTFPNRREIYDCLEDHGLLSAMDFYKVVLSNYTTVYDMEYPESKWVDDMTFADGCHFAGVDSLTTEDYRQTYKMQTDLFKVMLNGEGEEVRLLDHELQTKLMVSASDITLKGDDKVHAYSEKVQLEPGSVYIVSVKGDVPEDSEHFYADMTNSQHGSDARLGTQLTDTIEATGERFGIVWTNDLLKERDFTFRVVYQGDEDLTIDSIELRKVVNMGQMVAAASDVTVPGDSGEPYRLKAALEPNSTYLVVCRAAGDAAAEGFAVSVEGTENARAVELGSCALEGVRVSLLETGELTEGEYDVALRHGGGPIELEYLDIYKMAEDGGQLVCGQQDIVLPGDGEVNVWYETVELEPNTAYRIRAVGELDVDCDILYMDLCSLAEAGRGLRWLPAEAESEIGGFYDSVLEMGDLPGGAYYFRVVYRGNQELVIDNLELLEVAPTETEEN